MIAIGALCVDGSPTSPFALINTEYESSWQFFLQVMNTMHALFDDVEPDLAKLDLEPKSFFLLGVVDENPYPAHMAKALSLPNPTITFLLKRLEARAYVKRSNEPGDLRKYRFTLTAAGRKALLKGQSILGKRLDSMLGKLSVADRRQLFRLFQSLG